MGAAGERRRRKKVRIQDVSSSESESGSEAEMQVDDDLAPSELSDASESAAPSPSGDPLTEEHPRERLRKVPANQSTDEFNQKFLQLVTEQFGEELAALREANDFGPASITQLIAGLKQGVDIFTLDQQKLL